MVGANLHLFPSFASRLRLSLSFPHFRGSEFSCGFEYDFSLKPRGFSLLLCLFELNARFSHFLGFTFFMKIVRPLCILEVAAVSWGKWVSIKIDFNREAGSNFNRKW
jgi:hypothetical protein